MLFLLAFVLFVASVRAGVVCASGFTCAEDPLSTTVWVMKNNGNVNGPTCKNVCEDALGQSTSFHSCDPSIDAFSEATFGRVAELLGFTCEKGGCWDGVAPGEGMMLVSKDPPGGNATHQTRKCYYPDESKLLCNVHPGNANCFGERYSTICPCQAKALEEACEWSCPNAPLLAKWPTTQDGSCLARINYWRKKACEEGWVECPPSGLPPMTMCAGCNECVNSQARYDRDNGAHSSFKRCGELVQGVGGGKDCAAAIDAFVAERKPDANGVVRCEGHCGPIVKAGCQTFSYGHSDGKDDGTGDTSGTYVLNWRACSSKCKSYCDNPTKNGCFTTPASPSPNSFDQKCWNTAATVAPMGALLVTLLLAIIA